MGTERLWLLPQGFVLYSMRNFCLSAHRLSVQQPTFAHTTSRSASKGKSEVLMLTRDSDFAKIRGFLGEVCMPERRTSRRFWTLLLVVLSVIVQLRQVQIEGLRIA